MTRRAHGVSLVCLGCWAATVVWAGEGDYVCDGELLWQVVDGALVKAGKLTVADAFDTKAPEKWEYTGVAHCWEHTDNSLVTAQFGGMLSLKQVAGDSFVVQVKVKPVAVEPEQPGGFVGINVSGFLLTLQPGRYWWQYRRPGEERSTGGWREEEVPFGRWYDFKIVKHSGCVLEWFVDGRRLCSLSEPEVKGGIALHAWRVRAAYRDFRLYRIDQTQQQSNASAAINRVRNSSFEQYHDNLPPFWAPSQLRDIPFTYGSLENFYQRWSLDRNEKYEGNVSLRLGGGKPNGVRSHFCSVPKGEGTLSLYMKSDADAAQVRVLAGVPGADKRFEIGKDWARYTLAFTSPSNSRCRLTVINESPANVWLDAVQIEAGTVASAYRPNPLDFAAEPAGHIPELPPSRIVRIDEAPAIDGKLDDAAWRHAERSAPFRIPGKVPGEYTVPQDQTEAFLCHDDTHLYLGFKCHDAHMGQLKAAATAADDAAVAGDDCVEIFIDTNNDRQTFYRFVVNTIGTRFDSKGSDDISWTRDWTAKTHLDPDAWSLEVAIPLASLDLNSLTTGIWRINLCRGNPKSAEYACTSPVLAKGMYFHQAANYSPFKWDDPTVFRKYCCGVSGLALVTAGPQTLDLTGKVSNNSGRAFEFVVKARLAGRDLDSTKLPVEPGGNRTFVINGFPDIDSGDALVELKLVDAGSREVLSQATPRVVRESLMEAVAERSYYTTESEALIHVSLAVADALRRGASLVCDLRDQQGASVSTVERPADGSLVQVAVPLARLPHGIYDAKIVLRDAAGQPLASAAETIRKLPQKACEVKIDRIRRILLVDGKPFFPFAPLQVFHVPAGHPYGDYDKYIDTVIKFWAENGFKALMVGANLDDEKGPWGQRIWDQVFESADRHGLKIIAFWTGPAYRIFGDRTRLQFLIERWRGAPSLLAWMPEDEPEIKNVKPEEIAAAVRFIRSIDPYHPTYINYTQMGPASRYAGLPGDIMSVDYYLTASEGRTVKDTLRYVDIMQEVSAPSHVPVWNILTGSNLDNHPREPTAAEQTAQTYGNVVKGVCGLQYFLGQLAGRKHWATFKQLNRELAELTPVILAGKAIPGVKSSNPSILVMARESENECYLACVNIESREYEVDIDLSAIPRADDAEVLFEGRRLELHHQVLHDTFLPYQRHVYRLRIR